MLLAAVNFEDRLALLTDGRELPITAFYDKDGDIEEDYRYAVSFRVSFPPIDDGSADNGAVVSLHFEMSAVTTGQTGHH